MSTAEITLHIYSGREDPKWKVDHNHRHFREIVTKIEAHRDGIPLPGLGYRGFTVYHESQRYHVPKQTNIALEKLLLASEAVELENTDQSEEPLLPESRKPLLSHAARTHVLTHLNVDENENIELPVYNPNNWNIPAIQPYNNCYNYANNMITNTFAQPGKKHGLKLKKHHIDGNTVKRYATKDGLEPLTVNDDDAVPTNIRNLVALVIWPDEDFHWYRLDQTLTFSHKPGTDEVRNTDEDDHTIRDPRLAARGPYIEFVTFMRTDPKIVSII